LFVGAIARLFVVLALIGGTAYIVLVPPLQTPDEIGHLYRAWSVSKLEWVPQPLEAIPNRIRDLSLLFVPRTTLDPEATAQLRAEKILPLLDIPFSETDVGYTTNVNQNVMSPVPYLATGLAIGVGRRLHASAMELMYIGRVANLITFVGIVYWALCLLPEFRLIFFAIALMPMTLELVSSLSADAQTISLAMLLFAYVLKLSFDIRIRTLQWRHHAFLACLIVLNALCKSNAILSLLVLMIPREKLATRKDWWIAVTGHIALAACAAWLWFHVSAQDQAAYASARLPSGINVTANARFIFQQPVMFFMAFLRTIRAEWYFYLQAFVGVLGWYAVWLPGWLTWAYALFLVFLAVSEPAAASIDFRQRAVSLGTALASSAAVFVLLWEHEATGTMVQAAVAGQGIFPSLSGRYFIPFATLILIPLVNRKLRVPVPALAAMTVALVISANALGALRVWKDYYGLRPHRTAELPVASRISHVGFFHDGVWSLDSNGDRAYDFLGKDAAYAFGGVPGDIPVVGDWNGDGISKIGIYRRGAWYLDYNGNGRFDGEENGDKVCQLGGLPKDIPVTGDWTAKGRTGIGIFREGLWLMDTAGACTGGNGHVDQTATMAFGGPRDDIPVVGDWNGDGRSKVGVFRGGMWFLDMDGTGVAGKSPPIPFGGLPGDIPVTGDWNGDGRTDIGIYRSGRWMLNGTSCGGEKPDGTCEFSFGGLPGDQPVTGKWRIRQPDLEDRLVRRAGNNPGDDKVFLVVKGKKCWVKDAAWIVSHGYRWPADVTIIPAAELEAFPEGNDITAQSP
jgi:hypothetical protein